ncbi:S-formylglutathione hydrolase [Cupriavidus necator]
MIELLSEHVCHGGRQQLYSHPSAATGLPMRFSAYLPPAAAHGPVPALIYLAGLTCNEETFVIKAGAQRFAAQHGLMLIAPDTSPRGAGIEQASADSDFGLAASFYVDAVTAPWSRHFRMESYIAREFPELIESALPVASGRIGIMGHSMGGHGALMLALRHPGRFRSVSALAPIAAPTQCPWGRKAFAGYFGGDVAAWAAHDATQLMAAASTPYPQGILVDQGIDDPFLASQLHPSSFEDACRQAGQPLELRRHPGYDHGYFFITTFIEDHIAHHAARL